MIYGNRPHGPSCEANQTDVAAGWAVLAKLLQEKAALGLIADLLEGEVASLVQVGARSPHVCHNRRL